TPQPRCAQSQPQAPHRRGLWHQARRHQQASENAPHDGGHDEGDGRRQARTDGGPCQYAWVGWRYAEPGRDGQACGKIAGRLARDDAWRANTRIRSAAENAGFAPQFYRLAGTWSKIPQRSSRIGEEEVRISFDRIYRQMEKGN